MALVVLTALVALPAALADDRVGSPVYQKLAGADTVRVLIVLALPPGTPRSLPALTDEVSRSQEIALGVLQPGEFALKHRYQAIPALAGEITGEGLEKLLALNHVLKVDVDEGGSGSLAQAVPLTNSDAVQALGLTGQGVTVAVLDSGVDTDHLDLGDDLVDEACFCSGGGGCCPGGGSAQFGAGAAEDDHGHGSNVAGIVTSGGNVAPTGVSPDAEIVAIKVLDSNNSFCCSSDVVAGLDWIIAGHPEVNVVNMSLGTSALFAGDCDNVFAFTMAYAAAINTLRANGVTTFASSGNDRSATSMTAPACIANALAVGAVWDSNVGSQTILGCTDSTTAADQVTCFSNSNSATDLFGPGAPITSAWRFNGTSTFYGTSQASPHAAGCAANMLQGDPTLTPDQIEAALEGAGVPVTDPKNGLTFPRIDCLAALCLDGDEDGFGDPGSPHCSGGPETDCDDTRPDIFPGSPEICDGLDNDCNDAVDDLPPPVGAPDLRVTPDALTWTFATPGTGFDAVKGDGETLRLSGGDFTLATDTCLGENLATLVLPFTGDPAVGTCFWFSVRAVDCGVGGTYDSDGPTQIGSRDAGIEAADLTCPPVGCGNSILEAGELCDGTALGGETCQGLGFTSGALACNVDCQSFDTSGCS